MSPHIRIRRFSTAAGLTATVYAALVLGPSHASAAPRPIDDTQVVQQACPTDVKEFAAHLREAGFTAQAANIAAQLTTRDCRIYR